MNSILREYSIKNIIGKGTFSIVKLGIDRKTGEKVAIKILEKKKILNNNDAERVEREIEILKNINHINLIKINKIKEDSNNYYMIMEYCEIGELFQYIIKRRKLDENESAYFYFQLINGLEYIHSKNIVHRDLKPENLLINKNNILKIIDFGLSNYNKNNELLDTPCGSPCYAAPEMIAGKKYVGNYIDIWSSGIILFVMLCGYLPFQGQNNEILFNNIMICKVEYPKYLSNISVNLLQKILVPFPENRISLPEIKNHPFYNKGKEIFKKIHPSIFEKLENNCKIRQIFEKKNYEFNNCIINKTEDNEKIEHNFKPYFHVMIDKEINKKLQFINNHKSIGNLDKVNEKKEKKILFKHPLNKRHSGKNKKCLFQKELNNLDRYIYEYDSGILTEVNDYSSNNRKKSEKINMDGIRKQKDLSKLLRYSNNISINKETSYLSNNKKIEKKKVIYSPVKIRSNFHSIDIDNSNLLINLFNYYKFNQDRKNCKNFQEFNINNNNNIKKGRYKEYTALFPTFQNNNIIKKIKTNKKIRKKNNSNNNTKIIDKYENEEKYLNNERKKSKNADLNTLNISKNNNNYNLTEFFINNNVKNARKRHISNISFNWLNLPLTNHKNDETKYKKRRKVSRILTQVFNEKTSKIPINSKQNLFKNKFIISNLNYDDTDKNILKDNNSNNMSRENDNNNFSYHRYNRPSVTINNMNYNLNLYEPKIYVSTISTLNHENMRKHNNFFYKKNQLLNKKEPFRKNSISITNNYNTIKKKNIDYLNFLTQDRSIIDESFMSNNNNYTINKYFIVPNNNHFVKIKKYRTINKVKLFSNSKDKNINRTKEVNNDDILNSINNNNYKKLNKGRMSEFGTDLLNKIRQKKIENKNINTENQRQKLNTPSVTIENNSLFLFNNINHKTKVLNFINKKKNNKLKKSNDRTKTVIDTLIKDFINLNDIKKNIKTK